MKVKPESQLGLLFRDKRWRHQIESNLKKHHYDPKYGSIMEERKKFFEPFFLDDHYKDLLLTDKVKDIATKIKLGPKFNYSFLKRAKNRAATYLIDKSRFFRYYIDENFLYIFHLRSEIVPAGLYTTYHTFRINLDTGEILDQNPESFQIAEEFARLMIFVEFSEVSYKFLKPKQKVGNVARNIMNSTPLPFTVVDTSWNQVSVRTDGFQVKGHIRVQPCGKGFEDRKLIWIDSFEKSGYIRRRNK